MAPAKILFLFLLPLLCVGTQDDAARPSAPDLRQSEIHKIILDLQNPAVVVFVALRPGTEDYTALAHLHLGRGAKVTTVFVSNGESLPNDLAGENQRFTAGRRKEEAYESATCLGTQAYFLNLPDPGVLSDAQALRKLWNRDTLSTRLSSVLEAYHPDFIFLTRDALLGDGSSLSWWYLQETLIRVAEKMSSASGVKKGQLPVSAGGPSPRVFVDNGRQKQKYRFDDSFRLRYPDKTVADMGREAAGEYRSLRWQQAHLTSARREYTLAYPRLKTSPTSFDSGVPVVPPELRTVSDEIGAFTRHLGQRRSDDLLARLQDIIVSVEKITQSQGARLSAHDEGILARWKNGLEDLRCALLGVDCDVSLSDSLVAKSQLFYLNINSFAPKLKPGSSEIYIPKVNNVEWIVNETLEKRFPFEGPVQYRILTPENLPMNAPNSTYGLLAARMRLNFLFLIVHRDSVSAHNFIYRKEIPIRTSPAQSFELLHDILTLSPNDPLTFRIKNISRDSVWGRIQARDSVLQAASKDVIVPGRSELFDKLQLSWKNDLPFGEYAAEVWASKKEVHRFLGRKFPCIADDQGTVGIISPIAQTPVVPAVRRLGLTPRMLNLASDSALRLSDLQTIIIDRDAFAADQELVHHEEELWRWVSDGGRLVLLDQFHAQQFPFSSHLIPHFQEGKALDAAADVLVDSSSTVLCAPNVLKPEDWDGWVFAKAYGSLAPGDSASGTPVRARQSGMPLLTTTRTGKGLIICVALNLDLQLSSIVPGAYRLLANILSTK